MNRLLLSALTLAASFSTANAADLAARNWPQWRGPAFNGTAPQGTAPTTWSETEHVKWKFKIPGEGTATPIV